MDRELMRFNLPPEFTISNRVEGVKSNPEDYIRELINKSSKMMQKTNGEVFYSPYSEAHGECDCITEKYSLDIKLLGTSSRCETNRMNLLRKIQLVDGVVVSVAPKSTNGRFCSYLHTVCAKIHYEDCASIMNGTCNHLYAEFGDNFPKKDLRDLVEIFECKKNIILVCSDGLFLKREHSKKEMIAMIEEASERLLGLTKWRTEKAPGMDTYFAIICDGLMFILVYNGERYCYFDDVNLQLSEEFKRMYSYIYEEEKKYIRLNYKFPG